MQNKARSATVLRSLALAALLATLGTWAATGAHLGWTQTSKVTVQHDEITGIDYPVRQKAFVAGVEVLVAGAGLAAVLAGTGFLLNRHPSTRA